MEHTEQLRAVLAQRPCGLLTDIDGTISPIAPTPDAAFVQPEARRSLAALAGYLDVVAAVSGRAAADAAALVDLPELVYIGNHGMDRLVDGVPQPIAAAEPFVAAVATVLHASEVAYHPPGVLYENKGATGSVHFRLADDPERTGSQLRAVLDPLVAAHGLVMTGGRQVWEIRPPLTVDKGTAARALVLERGLRGVIFMGDDRTDTDAFVALSALRAEGGCVVLNVGVVGAETPDIVRELADITVDRVAGAVELLAQLLELARDAEAGSRPALDSSQQPPHM